MIRHRSAAAEVADDGRTVVVRLVAWDVAEEVSDDGGRTTYREMFTRGGLTVPDGARVPVTLEHGGPVVGRLRSVENRPDGLYGTLRIADTTAGRDALGLLDPTVELIDAVSVEFDDDPTPARAGELVVRSRAELAGVALTADPQHSRARVLAIRSNLTPTPEDPDTMNTDDTTTDETTTDDTDTDETTETAPAVHERSRRPAPTQRTAPRPGAGASSRFRSFGEYARAAATGELRGAELARYRSMMGDATRDARRYLRAWDAPTLAEVDGLLGDAWIRDVIDLYRLATPTVQAFARRPLPETGMVVSRPAVEARPAVVKQATPGTAPTSSTAVQISTVTWNVETYHGGQNTPIQVLLRSDPSYVDQLMRLYTREMALTLNEAAAASVLAAADDVNTPLEYTTAAAFQDLVIDASATFLTTMHRMAEVAVLSVDLWKALGKLKDSDGRPVYPGLSPMNPAGSFSVRSPEGQIRDLDYVVEPAFSGITAVLGVRDAFETLTGAMSTMTADTPQTLGRDMAVYQFAAFGPTDASGLVLVENDTP